MSPPRKREKKEGMMVLPLEQLPSGVVRLEVDKVSLQTFEAQYSPVVDVGGVPWRVNVYNAGNLHFTLYSMIEQSAPWRIDVDSHVTIFNIDRSKNFTFTETTTFNDWFVRGRLSCDGFEDFINEEKGFINDNKMTIEIRFSITRMDGIMKQQEKVMRLSSDHSPSGVIRFEVDKVSSLDFVCHQQVRQSPDIIVGGVPWRARVFKDNGHLSLYLCNMIEQSTPWIIDVDAQYIIINSDISRNIAMKRTNYLEHRHNMGEFCRFNWVYLIKAKGFIRNDKITVEIRFSITSMKGIRIAPRFDFTDPNEPSHDVALVIEGEKIYVNKGILAIHSTAFNTMFYGNFEENNKKEIELKGIDREELMELFNVIYSSQTKITDDSVEYLLYLADYFVIPYVFDRAEDFLLASREISLEDKLRIADQYRHVPLYRLQNLSRGNSLRMSPPRKTRSEEEVMILSPADSNSGVIRFEVNKVSMLDNNGQFSPVVEVGGVPWKLKVYNSQSCLCAKLFCLKKKEKPWSMDVDVQFVLVHTDRNKNVTFMDTKTFKYVYATCARFLQNWDDLMNENNGFIKYDKITVEVHISIKSTKGIRTASDFDFTESPPSESSHDITLVVGGEKIHANKGILAVHSPVFNRMFYGDFADKNEIELKDIDRTEFIELLHVIYSPYKKITDESAEYLLNLADRFQIMCVTERVEDFLVASTSISHTDKNRLAREYKLYKLYGLG